MKLSLVCLVLVLTSFAAWADADKKLNGDVSVQVGSDIKPFESSSTHYKTIQIVDQSRKVICYAVVSERGPATGTTPATSCVKFE